MHDEINAISMKKRSTNSLNTRQTHRITSLRSLISLGTGMILLSALLFAVLESGSYDARVIQGADDAKDGNNSDQEIEMGADKWIGVRFQNITIPEGATILDAYLEFTAFESKSDPTPAVDIYAHDVANPGVFTNSGSDITGRTLTSNLVSWTLGSWTENNLYQSPDLTALVQELVNTYGAYSSGNMAFILKPDGSEKRKARAYDDNPAKAPRLVINYGYNLPVRWLDFQADLKGTQGMLSWKTASELNCDYYQVERSIDGTLFESIAAVAGVGTSTEESEYKYVDNHLVEIQNKSVYYRLKQVDLDGKYEYSNVLQLSLGKESGIEFSMYPNPVVQGENLQIQYIDVRQKGLSLKVMDDNGKVITSKQLARASSGSLILNTENWASGLYIIHLSFEDYSISKKLFVR